MAGELLRLKGGLPLAGQIPPWGGGPARPAALGVVAFGGLAVFSVLRAARQLEGGASVLTFNFYVL